MSFQRPYQCRECGEYLTTAGAAERCEQEDLLREQQQLEAEEAKGDPSLLSPMQEIHRIAAQARAAMFSMPVIPKRSQQE